MARKKRDFDYMELYNPDYRAMKANIFSGEEGSSTLDLMGNNGINTDWTFGQQQNNITAPNTMYSNITTVNDGTPAGNYVDPLQTEYHRVNPIKYLTMSEAERMRQNQLRQEARQERREARQEAKQAAQTDTQNGGNTPWGNIIGTAATGIVNGIKNNDWSTKEGRTRGIFQSLGVADAANNWLADTRKGDANITEMTNRINNATNKLIQDSNDTQGAFNAIKNNNTLNLIDTGIKPLGKNDFLQSWGSAWKNTATGTLQGAAAGSVGGPWGALGGATVGTLSGVFGMFGRKRRAEKAYEEYKDKMKYLQTYARGHNTLQRLNQQQSNENLLNNGLKQQRIQDLSNIRAYGGNLFEDGGETPPPYYPESQDSTAIQWLSDWYRQRPEQLKNTFYGSTYEMPNPNISGEYEDLNEIPQERILSPTNRMFGDDLYKNLIDRAATASTIYRMDMPPSTLGEYSPAGRGILTENGPVDKPNAAHTISFNMRDVPAFANPEEEYYDEETLPLRVHEYNHPITHGFESLADSINSKAKRKEGVKYDEYDDNPYEIHSYMMEFRQRAGLDPTEKVTKDVLDKHRTELKKSNLDRFTDDSLIDMLNNVVDNSTNNYNNIAAMGGQFDFNLSPNMIDLQNQSLANQKYKYNNQIQPLGFMSNTNNKFSFGGNLFDNGGYGDFNKYGDNASLFERLKREADSVSDARYSAFMNSPEYSALDEELNNDIENAYKNYYDSYGSTHDIYNPNYQGNAMVLFGQFLNNKKLIPDSKVDELYNIAKKNGLNPTKNQIRESIANKLVEQYYAHRKLATGEENVNLGPAFQKWMNKRSDLLNSFNKSLSDYNNNNTDNEENNINAPDKIEYKGRVLTRDYYGDYHDVNDSYYTLQKQDAIDALSKGDATDIDNTGVDYAKTIQNGADLDDVVAKYMQENGIEDKSNTQNTVKRQKNTGRPTQRYSGYQQLSNMLGNEDAIKDFQRSRGIEVDGKVGNETTSEMQRFLNEQGYNLKVDGIFGEKTRQAYEDYMRKYNQDRYTEEKQRDLYEEPYFDINEAKNEFFSNTPYAMGGRINHFDFGGSMNGMDIPTGMQSYENGGTHEENPNGGIQVGVDNQGTPNLVEEGEFRWGDYVFSNRIDVDLDVLSDFNVPATKRQGKKANKGKLSYADLAKKMAKKAGDLNDPITKDTLNENMKRASQAQDFQKAQMNSDNQLADYKNALKNQTQGNPMYGSMKYNGMGNVNQGLNEGSSAMEGVDNSSLSNVNRSGNEMMAAYGGNLFAKGGRRRRNTVDLGYGQDYIPDLSDYKNAYYGNWGNNYAINSGVYDNGPHNAADLAGTEYSYLANRFNDSLPTYQQNVYIPNEYGQGLNYAGTVPMTDYGTIMQTRKLVEPEPEIIRQTNPMQIPVEISTMRPINFGTAQNNTSTNTSSPTNSSSYSSTSYKYSTKTPQRTGLEDYTDPLTPAESTQEGLPNSKDQAGIVSNHNLDEKHAQFATATTPTVPTLNTKGLYAQLGKGLTKNIYNWAGLANTEFKPNYKPEQDLRALGRTGYVPRTADHSGMYRAADLYDINLANNAAQAQAAATARAMSNVNDRNQRAANQLAADYNAMLGVGNNYQTMFDANMKSRLATDEYNKQTEQTNVAANNDMYRDNQQAGIQAKNFELSANTEANKMQWLKDQYADTQNRIAALNKQSDAARMADNQINFLVDKAKENAYYNLKNKDPRQMYWNDPSTGEWYFKGDNGYYDNLRKAMSGTGINSLDTTSNEELAAMADQKGWNNITEEDMKDVIARQYEREDKAKKDKEAKDAQDLRNAQIQYKQMLANIRAVNPDYNPGFKDSDFTTADDWLTGYNGLNTYWLSAINPYLANRKVDNESAYGGKIKTNKHNKNHSYDYMAI